MAKEKQDRADAKAQAAAEAVEAVAAVAAAAAAAAVGGGPPGDNCGNIVKSSSAYSCHSYESFVGQANGQDDNNKEKISIRSEGLDSVSEHRRVPNLSKIRKVSAVSVLIFMNKKVEIRCCLIKTIFGLFYK